MPRFSDFKRPFKLAIPAPLLEIKRLFEQLHRTPSPVDHDAAARGPPGEGAGG